MDKYEREHYSNRQADRFFASAAIITALVVIIGWLLT